MAFGAALGACFNPPDDAVLFACDAETAPTCPDGYTCASDGCCHRDGSDIEASRGSCRIGGMSAPGSASSDGSADASSTSGVTTSGDASTSTGADTGSSDAGTTT